MSLKEIKEMISLMNENGLSEIEMEREGLKVRLKKESAPQIITAPVSSHHTMAPETVNVPEPEKKNENYMEISSPMIGTFYRAPSPESPPYVSIGDTVKVGQVLCIVEAMKLMNEIKSEISGKIIDIKVANAEPIEFGQVMFIIEKN